MNPQLKTVSIGQVDRTGKFNEILMEAMALTAGKALTYLLIKELSFVAWV